MKTPIAKLEDFAALEPFFHIVQEGLTGFVEADHFLTSSPTTSSPNT